MKSTKINFGGLKGIILNLIAMLLIMANAAFAQAGVVRTDLEPVKYPDTKAVIQADEINYTLEKDGSITMSEYGKIKILNPEGQKKFSRIFRSSNKPYQTISVDTARILKPDGKIIELDRTKDITTAAELSSDSPVYENINITTIDFSKAEINDVIEFKIIYTNKPPVLKDCFFGMSFISDEFPIEQTDFSVSLPKGAGPLHYQVVGAPDKAAPAVVNLKDGKKYTWSFSNRPAMIEEPGAPAFGDRASYVLASSCPSWQALSAAYSAAIEPYLAADEKIKKKAEQLTSGLKTTEEKVYAIARYVFTKRKIQIGFEPDHLNLIPAAKIIDFEPMTKFDAGILFVSLLRAAGIDAYPALIAEHKFGLFEKDIPSPYNFNSLIAAFNTDKGWKYLDPTRPFDKSLTLFSGMEGRSVLVLKPKGEKLAMTAITPPEANLERMEAKAELLADGSAGITMRLIETGTKKVFWDTVLDLLGSSNAQSAIFGRLVALISEDAKLLGYNREMNGKENETRMDFQFMAEHYALISGKLWVVKMPIFPSQETELSLQKGQRIYPVQLGNTSREEKHFTMTLPEGFTVKSLPSPLSFSNRVGNIKVDCMQEGNSIVYNYQFQINKIMVPPSEYGDIVELFERAKKATSEVILLEAASVQPAGRDQAESKG